MKKSRCFSNSILLKEKNVIQKIWILEAKNDMYQDHVILHFVLFNLLGDDNLLDAFRI